MKQDSIKKAKKFVWLLAAVIPTVTVAVTYFMVTAKNANLDVEIEALNQQKIEIQSSYSQLTDEHDKMLADIREQEQLLADIQAEYETKMKVLEADIAGIRTDDDIEESLKNDIAEIAVAIEKAEKIEDSNTRRETLLPLQEQLDFDKEHLNDYYDLLDMDSSISEQDSKVKEMQSAETEQQSSLDEIQNNIDSLQESIERTNLSRPVMQTSIIYSVAVSVAVSLVLVLVLQMILKKSSEKSMNQGTEQSAEEIPEAQSSDTEKLSNSESEKNE